MQGFEQASDHRGNGEIKNIKYLIIVILKCNIYLYNAIYMSNKFIYFIHIAYIYNINIFILYIYINILIIIDIIL